MPNFPVYEEEGIKNKNMKKDFNNAKEIVIEINGKEYSGRYIVKRSIVSVISSFGEKSTQVGGSAPESIARLMLGELVRENK